MSSSYHGHHKSGSAGSAPVKALLRHAKLEPKDPQDAEFWEKAVKVLLKKMRKTGKEKKFANFM